MPTKITSLGKVKNQAAKDFGPGGFYKIDKKYRSAQLAELRDYKRWLVGTRGDRRYRILGAIEGIEACLALSKERGKYERAVGYRQEGGDDGYHYVVRSYGRAIMNGLTRTEAEYCKDREVKRLCEANGVKPR